MAKKVFRSSLFSTEVIVNYNLNRSFSLIAFLSDPHHLRAKNQSTWQACRCINDKLLLSSERKDDLGFIRLSAIGSLVILLCASASAQFEKEAGKIIVRNGFAPNAAGPGKVAFLRADPKIPGAPIELFTLDLASGKESRLLPGVDIGQVPGFTYAFSPSGKEFVLPQLSKGMWEIAKYRVGEREPVIVSKLADHRVLIGEAERENLGLTPDREQSIGDLTWSPSGNRLLFTFMRLRKNAIWWIDLASGNTRQATPDLYGYYGSFHPNDDLFVYTENFNKPDVGADQDLVLRSISTGKEDTLTGGPAHDFAGRISPDGKYIVFNRTVGGSNNVFVMNLATRQVKAQTNVTNGKQCAFPVWSPDGKRIFFQGNGFGKEVVVFVREFTPF